MNQEKKEPCNHIKNQECYICVNGPCVKNGIYKLSCHLCLLQDHPHPYAIQHIDQIIRDAIQNQQKFSKLISGYLDFCQYKTQQLGSVVQEIKEQVNKFLDSQQIMCQQQIDQYKTILLSQKQQIEIPEMTQQQLSQILGFKLFDTNQFQKDNQFIQNVLEQNLILFRNQFPIVNPTIYTLEAEEFPKLMISYLDYERPKFQVCQNNHDLFMSAICLHDECLDNISLKCPVCLTTEHFGTDHSQYFIFNKLEEEYKNKLSELESFCNEKAQIVWSFFEKIPKMIVDFEIIKQNNLIQFKQFIFKKGKEILQNLQKYQVLLQLDVKLNIEAKVIQYYPQLFVNKLYSRLAEFDFLNQSFEEQITWFKQHFMQIKETDIGQVEDLYHKNMEFRQALDKQKQVSDQLRSEIVKQNSHIQQLNDRLGNEESRKKRNEFDQKYSSNTKDNVSNNIFGKDQKMVPQQLTSVPKRKNG